MIRADHFCDNGDGTAWIVGEWTGAPSFIIGFDEFDDGRTFEVQIVEKFMADDGALALRVKLLSASVVPGMVLPIHPPGPCHPPVPRCIEQWPTAVGGEQWLWNDEDQEYATPITLPPAAKPGMHAVKLAIHAD